MAKDKKTVFGCTECGATAARWSGKCDQCGAMNCITELNASERRLLQPQKPAVGGVARPSGLQIESLEDENNGTAVLPRFSSGLSELDRVLGGGVPAGGAILLGGAPGIGKSTLLAQCGAAASVATSVLYVTAEESVSQVRDRCQRLGLLKSSLQLAASNSCEEIIAQMVSGSYGLIIVDSIQVLLHEDIDGLPGSPSQVRGCAARLIEASKLTGCTVMLIGHVTKDGTLAGPRMLEHLVDTVLTFEGDRYQELRTLRTVKNRFGSTNEIGLFSMAEKGLEEVKDPGAIFIKQRHTEIPGSCIVPTIEGQRSLLIEVQALVNPTDFPQPMRRSSGLENNRVAMVTAVLSRRLHIPLGKCDVMVNATGGARIIEPGADLAIALAIVSAWRDIPVPADIAVLGEVGLGGELRPVPRYDVRAAEARKLGFSRLLGPGTGKGRGRVVVTTLQEAVSEIFGS